MNGGVALTRPDSDGTAAFLRAHLAETVDAALVLGSGLGAAADGFAMERSLRADEIPDYPRSTVPGHEGSLSIVNTHGRRVLVFRGRMHVYEGHSMDTAAFPALLAAKMGATRLILTNAAGGVNPLFDAGDLMLITDYLVLPLALRMGRGLSGLADASAEIPRAFMHGAQAADLVRAAAEAGIALQQGCYGYCSGPSYETRAEVRMLRQAGVDAIGMSSVPEIVASRRLGMETLGVSCITNKSSVLPTMLSHDDVTEVADLAAGRLSTLLDVLFRLP